MNNFPLVEGCDKCIPNVKVHASLDRSKSEDIFVARVYVHAFIFGFGRKNHE